MLGSNLCLNLERMINLMSACAKHQARETEKVVKAAKTDADESDCSQVDE